MRKLIALAIAVSMIGCGIDPGIKPWTSPPPPTTNQWTPAAPNIMVAAPDSLSVGEEMTILGDNFVPAEHGSLVLLLTGAFYDEAGQSHPVALQVKPRRISDTKLGWRMWPNVVFHPSGDQLGYFLGEAQVINVTAEGQQLASAGMPLKITVKPSLIPRLIQPRSSECQPVVADTLEQTPMVMSVEAIGIRRPTVDAPLTFRWTLLAKEWNVTFGYNSFNVESIIKEKGGAVILEEQVKEGMMSTISDAGDQRLIVKVAKDLFGDQTLKTLRTEKVPEAGNDFTANVSVSVTEADGNTISLTMPIGVHRIADLVYDGNTHLAERFEPVMVSGCIPGNDIGRNVSYREDKAETKARSMTFQYNASMGAQMGLPSNPFALSVNVNAGFGVDVNASVSSTTSTSRDISAQIIPGNFAVLYRQTTKIYRIGQLVGHNKCGTTVDLGEAVVTDWTWTPDIASGPYCPPATRLPKAQRFM